MQLMNLIFCLNMSLLLSKIFLKNGLYMSKRLIMLDTKRFQLAKIAESLSVLKQNYKKRFQCQVKL